MYFNSKSNSNFKSKHGMALNSEELIKFCQNIERKDKASKSKPRARPVSQSQAQ